MYRNPFTDALTGMMLALGGPLGLLLPQRIFLSMLTQDLRPIPVRTETRRPRP